MVVGKGGVGKTTCASALALRSALNVGETLVVSTDPARALPTVLETPVGAAPTRVAYADRLTARLLAAEPLRERFMEQWSDVIRLILDRGTYLDDADIAPLVDTALPGSDEIFAALELARLIDDTATTWDRIVVDTAPTGHTLRLLNLPKTFRALVRLLDAMQSKHRFMVRTLTRRYRADDADAFLAEMSGLVTALEESLTDPTRTAAVLVTSAEPIVMDETRRYLAALTELGIPVKAIVWNASDPAPLESAASQYEVPRLDDSPIGQNGLERWLRHMRLASAAGPLVSDLKPPVSRPQPTASSLQPLDPLLRPLTIVAGKGGVGKTTVATVLALASEEHARTLVVSTDPASSLADALNQPIPDGDTLVTATRQLYARQMNASAAFARLREEYQSRVDALFEALVARGVDLEHDRAIVRDLLALAPPGVDEVYALSLLSDALFAARYERVIVDPAPTGHLLRLLEMPQLALAWSHQLMRLMLKYKDVTGLGNTAQELLEFSRNLRALDALLHDSQKCGAVLVTLDEPVVREESGRLMRTIADRGVALAGIVTNRAAGDALPVGGGALHFEAPLVQPPPVGVDALRRWGRTWRPAHPE